MRPIKIKPAVTGSGTDDVQIGLGVDRGLEDQTECRILLSIIDNQAFSSSLALGST